MRLKGLEDIPEYHSNPLLLIIDLKLWQSKGLNSRTERKIFIPTNKDSMLRMIKNRNYYYC